MTTMPSLQCSPPLTAGLGLRGEANVPTGAEDLLQLLSSIQHAQCTQSHLLQTFIRSVKFVLYKSKKPL